MWLRTQVEFFTALSTIEAHDSISKEAIGDYDDISNLRQMLATWIRVVPGVKKNQTRSTYTRHNCDDAGSATEPLVRGCLRGLVGVRGVVCANSV